MRRGFFRWANNRKLKIALESALRLLREADVDLTTSNNPLQITVLSESSPESELPAIGFLADLSPEHRAFLKADPVAGVAVLQGLLHQASSRIRHMNEKLADAEQRASFHHFWTTQAQ